MVGLGFVVGAQNQSTREIPRSFNGNDFAQLTTSPLCFVFCLCYFLLCQFLFAFCFAACFAIIIFLFVFGCSFVYRLGRCLLRLICVLLVVCSFVGFWRFSYFVYCIAFVVVASCIVLGFSSCMYVTLFLALGVFAFAAVVVFFCILVDGCAYSCSLLCFPRY